MKLLRVGRISPVFRPKRYTTVVALLIVIAGVASGLFAAATSSAQKRDYLIGRAQTISDTMPVSDVTSLHGNQDDLSTLAYYRVKRQLEQVRSSNLDIARIRLFTTDKDGITIKADALAPDSSGYASPGTVYAHASPALHKALTEVTPVFDRLTTDDSGRWVAAYTPILDPTTKQVVGVVGVFVAASSYYMEIVLYALVPMLLAAIPLAGILRDIKIQAKEHEIMQLKNQFVSIASHELRSPLTGMLWGIQIMQQDESRLSLKQRGLLHDMYLSTESSLATVNEILDLSIFERAKGHVLQRDLIDLGTVIDQVISTLKLGAQEKGVEIHKNGRWPKSIPVMGDVGALKRGLMNIIANAIKYTHAHDTVVLAYRKSPTGEHIISVQDHGIGIPPEEQKKVLEGYYRATNASKVQAHGTGLGLWLTRKILAEHGGRIWLNSTNGKGTTIFIAVPNAKKSFMRPQPEESAQSSSEDQGS